MGTMGAIAGTSGVGAMGGTPTSSGVYERARNMQRLEQLKSSRAISEAEFEDARAEVSREARMATQY